MTWKPNPRKVTDQQFSEGTTIDGDRIDVAIEDVVDRFNYIKKGDIGSRWVPNQFVMGWSPQKDSVTSKHYLPWLDHCNDDRQIPAGVTAPDEYENRLREKGYAVEGIEEVPP